MMREFWNSSSTATRIILVVAAIALGAALVLVLVTISGLGGRNVEPTPVPPVDGGSSGIIIGGTVVPVPTAPSGIPRLTATGTVNIRSGPGIAYERIGILTSGASAEVVGRNADSTWWAIKIPGAPSNTGWVDGNFVVVENVNNVPVLEVPPPAIPSVTPPPVITDWRGEYFSNPELQGDPVVVFNSPEINFDWGTGAPAPGMPAENWSGRWTIDREVPAGTYHFNIWVDDGVRLWVDDTLIVDGWQEGGIRNYTASVNVTQGPHRVRVEYFQARGSALLQMEIGYVENYPDWKAEYFSNPGVEGAPTTVRNDQAINFNWGTGSPAPGIPSNNYSVRWSRRAFFEEGNYTFRADVSGGIRLWLDGRLLIDDWINNGFRTISVESGLINRGDHDLRVDYFKLTGEGRITVNWQAISATATPAPQAPEAIIAGDTQGTVGSPILFSGRSSRPGEGRQIVGYEWNFGDGTGSSAVDVSHTYDQAGTYSVSLTVIDDIGQRGSTSVQVLITANATVTPSAPPVARISAPAQGVVGQPITFDGSASTGSSPLVGYVWNFGDGFTADAVVVEHTYAQAGSYVVSLTVVDSVGQQNQTQVRIDVTSAAQPTSTPPPGPDLTGPTWILTTYNDGSGAMMPALADVRVTALFDPAGTLSGEGGCNTYTAGYTTSGGSLSITLPTATGLVCESPTGIMVQESRYLSALPQVASFTIGDGQLSLFNSASALLMVFQAGPTPR